VDNTVLISGASIAGPSLAYWLNRCGFRPTVVEKARTAAPVATRLTYAASPSR
jgi:2-polyprenyl-6-methoxyphenol hydroxylase-like FAD-dependent oxidoreductase